jgi:N-acetylmuramoyl-L-alanine amidase
MMTVRLMSPFARLHPVGRAGAGRRAVYLTALAIGLAICSLGAQAPTARDLFVAAQGKEAALHDALVAPAPVARETVLDVIAAYRLVVHRFPTSGYCDNALWQAAQLAEHAFARYGEERDRRLGIELYKGLASQYPTSRFAGPASAEAAHMATAPRPPDAATPATPPHQPPAASTTAVAPKTPPRVVSLLLDIRRRVLGDGVQIELDLDAPATARQERVTPLPRFFVDLAATRALDAMRDSVLSFESGAVRQIRVVPQGDAVTRIILDTTDEARCTTRTMATPPRVVIACSDAPARTPERAHATPPAKTAPSAGPPRKTDTRPAPVVAPRSAETPVPVDPQPSSPPASGGVTGSPAATRPKTPAPGESTAAPLAPPANGRGGYSIARQLGLRVGRIVIDPGHGGRDPGALSSDGSEASVTLDIALRLEKLLAKEPGVEVVLTRRGDDYVGLQERTAIANKANADLFVSIHVNANRDHTIRGVETYVLNFAATPDAAAVAARENASSTLTMSHLNDLVKQIALGSKVEESRDLAGMVQNAIIRRLRAADRTVRDLGVKQAPFVVLIGASMPCVLVEVAFLTHPQEGRLLFTPPYRQHLAESLLDGIRRYLKTLKRTDATAEPAPDRPNTRVGIQ